MNKFKIGDVYNIPQGTKVKVNYGVTTIEGIVVGKSSTDISQQHIIKCTDGYLPNWTYKYDTFISPLHSITIVDE